MNRTKKLTSLQETVKESQVTYEVYANLPDDGNRYEVATMDDLVRDLPALPN
jgi:hypothetical protein